MVVKYPLESYYGAMDPQYGSAMSASVWRNSYLGAPTAASKALQLPEITKLGMSGIQNVEIGVIDPQHWEAIPKQHFEQMKQLARLQLGKQSMLSVHAPIQPDPGGFAENQWSEERRHFAQEFLRDVIDKAHEIQVDKDVPVPVTIHGSTQQAVQWKWDPEFVDKQTGKPGALIKDVEYVVDPESGQVTAAKSEIVQYPTGEEVYTTDRRLKSMNYSMWLEKRREISAVNAELLRAQEEYLKAKAIVEKNPQYEPVVKQWQDHIEAVSTHFDSAINNLFDRTLHILDAFKKTEPVEEKRKKYETDYDAFKNLQKKYSEQFKQAVKSKDINVANKIQADATREAWRMIQDTETPIFMPVDRWAQHEGAKTFAELAHHSFKNYGEKGPFISVENWQPSLAMGRAESLKNGIEEARRLFAEMLMKENKFSKQKADAIAAEKIKATWDIGHINILKSFGMPKEKGTEEFWEKHLKKEVKEIKDYIGHIHISDNFGYQDVHLPPGMGNTPIKEFLRHMEETGKLGKVKSILESSGMAIHLGIPPSHTEALSYFNVPLYPGISTPAPTWGALGGEYFFGGVDEKGAYTSGYGKFLPEGHFGEYGTGFSQLPYAFGGVRPGTEQQQSKFSGTPMS